jgi:V/A-type H+-transporting ATPase subunit D
MLANREIDVSGLVRVESFQIEEENLVGVKLPALVEVTCNVMPYSMLAKPHWVDMLVEQIKQMVEQKTSVQVAAQRVRLLEQAERRVTQRVNLFDKILIPTAKKNIKKIQIYLADAERAAVVRSKITKKIRKRQAADEQPGN